MFHNPVTMGFVMATTLERKQRININEPQLDISNEAPAFTEDFESKLADAQTQLEMLHSQRKNLERQKLALEDLNHRKQEFMNGQLDLTEKLSSAITTIERELFESKQEMEDLEQTKSAFTNHLRKIESLNPEAWPKDNLNTELQSALMALDKAEDEYEQAVSYFTGSKRSGVFGGSPSSSRSTRTGSDFQSNVLNGLAFNLPVIVLGSLALLVYLLK